jgi:hypothetical protein
VVVCGAHTPGVGHVVYGPVHVPAVMSQVRECVTQLPQLSDGAVPVHGMLWPVQLPHSQLELQVCVPLELTPHFCVASGVQPPLFSPVHADQSDTLPVLPSQVRDCVPHIFASRLGCTRPLSCTRPNPTTCRCLRRTCAFASRTCRRFVSWLPCKSARCRHPTCSRYRRSGCPSHHNSASPPARMRLDPRTRRTPTTCP